MRFLFPLTRVRLGTSIPEETSELGISLCGRFVARLNANVLCSFSTCLFLHVATFRPLFSPTSFSRSVLLFLETSAELFCHKGAGLN